MGLFARKIFNLRREKIRGCFCRVFWCKKSTSRLARNVHHKDTYLRLKTDCNPTSVPRRQGIPELLRVCPPGRNPGGNTRRSGVHRVSSCFSFSLFSYFIPAPFFFRRKDQCRKFNCRAARRKKKHRRERDFLMHRQTDRQTTVTVVLMKEKSSPKKKQNNGRRRRTEEEKKKSPSLVKKAKIGHLSKRTSFFIRYI